jgi:UDP-N-acetylmuramyl pentapeptide synthase
MLELGFDSDKYHFHLGVELARFNLEHIFLVGKETKAVKEGVVSAGGSTKKISSYDTAENVTGELKKYLSKDVAVLFKGSRGIQLEKALETL